MATNKVGLKSVEEFMEDYIPVYQPIYPLLLGKSRAYSEEAGKQTLRRVETIGDIRGKHLTPKDTEIKQVSAKDASKVFKKYFLANQFILSHLQSGEGTSDVVAQVLDEHQVQFDELMLLGEGTNASNMNNNGLYWSNDSNYILESSYEIQKDADSNYLLDMHAKVMQNVATADLVAGRKVIFFYGTLITPLFDSLYPPSTRAFKAALQEILGPNYSLAKIPPVITPSGANGWIIVNYDQVVLHYTTLPALNDQGSNDEKKYDWFNFMMGSCMLEVLARGGIVRQPATLEA